MSPNIICLGELLVEIMRTEVDTPHGITGASYKGPFPSGAPAIFIDSAARMSVPFNLSTGFIGTVGNDEFGEGILKKLKSDGVDISKIRIDNSKTTGIAFNQYNSDGSRKFIFAAGAAGETAGSDPESFCNPPGTFPIYLVQNNLPLTDCAYNEHSGLSAGMALHCIYTAPDGMHCGHRCHICAAWSGACCPG